MNGQMVLATLDGRKTHTRRVVKMQDGINAVCPYGKAGDTLRVKETHGFALHEPSPGALVFRADGTHEPAVKFLRGGRWKPSIFMRREHSRITLEIESVRVERLQDISEADARAEGVNPEKIKRTVQVQQRLASLCHHETGGYRIAFEELWESINGPGSWELNPLVWVIKFKKI